MIVDMFSLITGGIMGFIMGIALIKEHYNNRWHELKEECIRLEYEKQALKYKLEYKELKEHQNG